MRGTFSSVYLIGDDKLRDKLRDKKRHRLTDLVRFFTDAKSDQTCGFLAEADCDEFTVFDMKTGQKAWLEWPQYLDFEQITGLISSHFGSTAYRIFERDWVV